MTSSHAAAGSRPLTASIATIVATVAVMAISLTLVITARAQAAATAVGLGTAKSFVVLAGAGVTNTGPTTLNGDLGTYPTKTIKGPGTITVNGTNHGGDDVTKGAKDDLVTAYNTAAGEKPPIPIKGDLGGKTLTEGVYNSASTIGLTGTLTLNAEGRTNAVFVFQAGSSLTTASASRVLLINGAQACNVFWQIGASATLGTASRFTGTVLALTSITVTTGTRVEGRVLARNGTVTLDTNTITRPTCSAVTPPPSGTPTATPTPTTTGTPSGPPTGTATPTGSPSAPPTGSPSAPPTGSPSAPPTGTATSSPSPSETGRPTPSSGPTSTATAPGTVGPTSTATPTGTAGPTSTATAPGTAAPTSTSTATAPGTAAPTSKSTANGTVSPTAQVLHRPGGPLDTGSYTDGTDNVGAKWAGLGALVVAGAATVIGVNARRARRH